MYSLNRATIIGNLTRDPEMRQIPSGQSVCTFGVATNRVYNDASGQRQEQTEFHNIVAWGKLAEICGQYLTKGKKIYVEGRLQTRDWEGQDGVRRYRTEIVMENMIFLDRASSGSGSFSQTGGKSAFSASSSNVSAVQQESPESSEQEIKIEDIPF